MFEQFPTFLRYVEGVDGGQATQQEADSGSVDWEAKYKDMEAKFQDARTHSRTWEKRAKENLSAAEKLAEVEESKKTETQKLTERLESLEKALTQSQEENEKIRFADLRRQIAFDEGVSKVDLEFMPTSGDEELLRKHAKRLARGTGAEAPGEQGGTKTLSRDAIIKRAENL